MRLVLVGGSHNGETHEVERSVVESGFVRMAHKDDINQAVRSLDLGVPDDHTVREELYETTRLYGEREETTILRLRGMSTDEVLTRLVSRYAWQGRDLERVCYEVLGELLHLTDDRTGPVPHPGGPALMDRLKAIAEKLGGVA